MKSGLVTEVVTDFTIFKLIQLLRQLVKDLFGPLVQGGLSSGDFSHLSDGENTQHSLHFNITAS